MRGTSRARFVNGLVSATIVVFFLLHGTLGAVAPFFGFTSPFAWVIWCGVALVGVHVIVSVVTSREQLTDAEFPPSPRKKRHLVLKWATGIALALAATGHIVAVRTFGAASVHAQALGALAIVAVAVLLAVHLCVGSKSLLKDLNIDRNRKTAFRIVACVFAAFFGIAATAALML